jgi:hypothetical protein
VATSTFAPVTTELPAVPPSAIVPQRANLARNAGRPPRIPRGEKKNPSPIKEQQEEVLLTKEIRVSAKRRIKTKQEIIEDNIEVIIEQQNEILPDIINQVQSTPLRGRKKKIVQENVYHMPQLEPPPPPVLFEPENEIIPKKTRGGRGKKKDEEEVKPTRPASVRNRKKQEEKEDIPPPPKKTTRNKKLVEPEEVNKRLFLAIIIDRLYFRFHHYPRKFVLPHHVVKRNHHWKYQNRLFYQQQRNQKNEKAMKIPMKIQLTSFK